MVFYSDVPIPKDLPILIPCFFFVFTDNSEN